MLFSRAANGLFAFALTLTTLPTPAAAQAAPASPAAASVPANPALNTTPARGPSAPALATHGMPPMRRRSPGMIVIGSLLAGGGFLVAGSGAFASIFPCSKDCRSENSTNHILMYSGVGAMLVGIPLIVLGAKRVPVDEADELATPVPKWVGSPGGAGWNWKF